MTLPFPFKAGPAHRYRYPGLIHCQRCRGRQARFPGTKGERPTRGTMWRQPSGSPSAATTKRPGRPSNGWHPPSLKTAAGIRPIVKGVPEDLTRESNMSSYIAVGVFHHYLITQDRPFLEYIWPTVCAGIDLRWTSRPQAARFTGPENPQGKVDPMALLTGCSSIFMSLKCALVLAAALGREQTRRGRWHCRGWAMPSATVPTSSTGPSHAIPWTGSIRFSAALLPGAEAKKRIDQSWNKFMVEGLGTRCVSDNPWVTIAETSELILTLAAMGELRKGRDRPELDQQ